MKIIDLLNKIANGEEVPEKIKYNSIIYNWDIKGYLHYEDEHYSERAFLEGYRTDMVLNDEVEILEDNTEDIEELDIQSIEEIQFPNNTILRDTRDLIINQLVKAVKQLDKKNDN